MTPNPTPGNDGLMPFTIDKRGNKIVTAAEAAHSAEIIDRIADLLCAYQDPHECSRDHHGGCQEHGFLGLKPTETCPNAELFTMQEWLEGHRDWLEAVSRSTTPSPAPVVTGWIACKERMPDAGQFVLVYVFAANGYRDSIQIASWFAEEVEWNWGGHHRLTRDDTSHWMPLPPPPGQEQGVGVSEEMVQAALRVWYSDGMSRSPTLRELLTASWGPCDNGGKYQTEMIMHAAITAALAAVFPVDTPDNTTKVQPQ